MVHRNCYCGPGCGSDVPQNRGDGGDNSPIEDSVYHICRDSFNSDDNTTICDCSGDRETIVHCTCYNTPGCNSMF